MGDDHVDRPEVYAQQCVQLTGTNRPRAWIFGSNFARVRYGVLEGPAPRFARKTIDLGGHSGGEIPVPIPNTEVKPASADGTWLDSAWESRTPPVSQHASLASARLAARFGPVAARRARR